MNYMKWYFGVGLMSWIMNVFRIRYCLNEVFIVVFVLIVLRDFCIESIWMVVMNINEF